MRELGLTVLLVASLTAGCLGGSSSAEEVEPASTTSNVSEANLTWDIETHEGRIAGTEIAGENVNVAPLSDGTRFATELPEDARQLRLEVSSEYGVELHIAPPDCEHDRFSDCHWEADGNVEQEFTWSAPSTSPGTWRFEVHSPHDFAAQPFEVEIGKQLADADTAASD